MGSFSQVLSFHLLGHALLIPVLQVVIWHGCNLSYFLSLVALAKLVFEIHSCQHQLIRLRLYLLHCIFFFLPQVILFAWAFASVWWCHLKKSCFARVLLVLLGGYKVDGQSSTFMQLPQIWRHRKSHAGGLIRANTLILIALIFYITVNWPYPSFSLEILVIFQIK